MVDEKSGKDKDGGQGLLAFLGSMYWLRKYFHFISPNSVKALIDPNVARYSQKKVEFLDLKNLLFSRIFLSGIGG